MKITKKAARAGAAAAIAGTLLIGLGVHSASAGIPSERTTEYKVVQHFKHVGSGSHRSTYQEVDKGSCTVTYSGTRAHKTCGNWHFDHWMYLPGV